jgi:O-succinylbenzoate synthase
MRIARIRLWWGELPAALHFSYGQVRAVGFCCAEVTAGGVSGVGECLAPVAREFGLALARGLVGQDARRLDGLLPYRPFVWQEVVYRELLSMALHDWAARQADVPLHRLLGEQRRTRVPLMPCLFAPEPAAAAATARRFVNQGFGALKVKLYGEPIQDAAIVRAVRGVLPRGFLQGDVNLGYRSLAEAQEVLPRLAEAGLDAVEDPAALALAEYGELLELAARPRLVLDQPTRGREALTEVLRRRCCDVVNLHPNMQGTFGELRERIALAAAAGVPVQVLGTGYTGVGAQAHLHVAAVCGEDFPYGEIGGWRDHGMPRSTARLPMPIADGCASVPDGPGHGGELDLAWLHRHAEVVELTTPNEE